MSFYYGSGNVFDSEMEHWSYIASTYETHIEIYMSSVNLESSK